MALVVDKLTLKKLVATDIKLPSSSVSTVVFTDSKKVATTTGSIPDNLLSQISSSGKVANSATTATDSATNSAIVARDGNGNISVAKLTILSQKCYSAISSGPQTIASATSTKFSNWATGTGDWINDSVTGDFKITRAGTWSISATVSWATNTIGVRKNQITLNGVVIAGTQFVNPLTGALNLNVCTTAVLAIGDVISVSVFQDTGGTLDVSSTRINMVLLF